MIKWCLNIIKQLVAKEELAKLERYQVLTRVYHQWLMEFPEIELTLNNIQASVNSKNFNGDKVQTYLNVSTLREEIRKMKK